MARWSDFLDRFRPAGAPGAAAPRGIPVDRAAAAAAELMPVLTRLDAVQDDAETVRREARARAAELREAARTEAEADLARAREDTEVVAAQAASRAIGEAGSGDGKAPADPADEVEQRVAARLSGCVDRVRGQARELLEVLCAADSDEARR